MTPRRRTAVAVLAVALLTLVTGVVPVWQYVDAATVPGGVTAQEAEVRSVDRGSDRRASGESGRGRIATVRLPDGTDDTVYLGYRWDHPETGDTLTVYEEDGELRTTRERSWLSLGLGVLALLGWPAITIGYLRHRSRRHPRDATTGGTSDGPAPRLR